MLRDEAHIQTVSKKYHQIKGFLSMIWWYSIGVTVILNS